MDREAVTAPVAMSIAVALFLGFFATIALNTNEVGGGGAAEATDTARLHSQADSLLDLMLKSPGYSTGGVDWIDPDQDLDPAGGTRREDSLVRLGLREADSNSLSWEKFENLRLAKYAASGVDGHVNYEDARAALGFDDTGHGFHIRAKPSLKSIQDILKNGERDPNLRVTYLADYQSDADSESLEPPNVSDPTCALAADGKTYTVSVTVENTGTSTTQFSAYVTIDPTSGSDRSEWVYGPKADSGEVVTLATSVPVDTTLCAAGAELTFDVWDPNQRWASVSTTLASSVGGTSHTHDLLVDPSKSYYGVGETVVVTYDGKGLSNSQSLTFDLLDGTGTVVTDSAITFQAGNSNSRSVTIGSGATGARSVSLSLGPGSYTARLTDGTVTVTDQVHVFASGDEPGDFVSPSGSGTSGLSAGAVTEVGILDDLIDRFCPYVYDQTVVTRPVSEYGDRCDFVPADYGDVIPDQKKDLNDVLPLRLVHSDGTARYDYVSTLVVGSNVDHQAMTSASAKHAVRDWVLGGGTLIVYGSTEQAVQWLQPIFHAGISGGGGGLGTPDPDHPLLHVSDTLNYDRYDHHERVWDLQESGGVSSADKFTYVSVLGLKPTLTISDPGAYGEGTVILTTWTPFDIFGDGSDSGTEGAKVVNNLLMQSYRGLFLDYGPPIPEGQAVVPATGKAQVFHPELGRMVSLDVSLFVFRQS